jgi:hypothetical protein
MPLVNQATGEVTDTIGGTEFRFRATMPRVADLQAQTRTAGFGELYNLVLTGDARALYHGLKSLCTSGNADKFDGMLFGRELATAQAVVLATLSAGLPESEPGKESAAGKSETKSPGDAIGN